MTFDEAPFNFASGSLELEGALHQGSANVISVVMHPHPLYGGDMHNPVVVGLCRTFAALGVTTLRFNTRGTGRSEGSFDDGPGERDDARAAVATLRQAHPDAQLLLAGYSFGALIAATLAAELRPQALVLVSPPVRGASLDLDGVDTLIVTGEADQVAPAADLRRFESVSTRLAIIPGADHGWWTGLAELLAQAEGFAKTYLALMAD